MEKRYKKLAGWQGVNRAISKRDSEIHLNTLINMDSNIVEGMLISRKGSEIKQSSGATPNIDKFIQFRDEQWQKDVLLVYDKDATAADRKIYVYTRTINTDNSFAPHTTASYSYGSLRFGDRISFLVHRNGARIGTGTAAANKAMFAGYINREVGSDHDAMFNDAISFSDFFLLKQQWVQQTSLVDHCAQIIYDSTRDKYYLLTTLGLEIRDSDFYVERILSDVTASPVGISAAVDHYVGGLALSTDYLYAIGKIPDSNDTKLIRYDLTNDLNILTSVTFDWSGSGERGHCVTTNGTNVYITWFDGTDGHIREYGMDLTGAANRATSAGNGFLLGITYDSTYVYACDRTNGTIIRMLIASPYTASTYTLAGLLDIEHYNGNLYMISTTVTYELAAGDFGTPASHTAKYTDTDQTNESISFLSAIPWLGQRGRLINFDGVTNFNETGYVPTKVSLATDTAQPLSTSPTDYKGRTYFYAFSIIDIYGQESHLHQGGSYSFNGASGGSPGAKLTIMVNIDSENFAEMTAPSTDPDEELSVWNEFRRMKKIRVYRAYNDEGNQPEPTTSYRFLSDIDINDPDWSEVAANVLYRITIEDKTTEANMSTVTYEESSGLPETFKPYYTNWQYGIKFEDRYYYGNVLASEGNAHEIIETPINSPDAAYEHDQNVDYFYTDDGDEIKGFAQVWNRLLVFKGNNTAIYNGLTKETTHNIGTSAPDSILIHNNVAYFIYGTGIYAMTPSGFERISEPVDELLAAESSLTGVSAVHFKQKQKLWFMVPNSKSYCFNYNKNTFDVYDITTGSRVPVFIGRGLDDTIFTTDSYDNMIRKENVGYVDGLAGNPIQIKMITNDIALGDGYLDTTLTRLFLTASSTDTLPVIVYWRNRNGVNNTTKTFAASSALATLKFYLSSVWGQYVRFDITKNITAEVRIDSIGFEFIADAGSILQDAS